MSRWSASAGTPAPCTASATASREWVVPDEQMPGRPGGGPAPLIGTYTTAYYGTGDTAEAMREMTWTLRRVKQGAFTRQ